MVFTRRRSQLTALPLIAAGTVFGTLVLCNSAFANAQGMFDSMDQDRNGRLVPEEMASHPAFAAHFARADLNRDGELSLPEFEVLLTMPGAQPTVE